MRKPQATAHEPFDQDEFYLQAFHGGESGQSQILEKNREPNLPRSVAGEWRKASRGGRDEGTLLS